MLETIIFLQCFTKFCELLISFISFFSNVYTHGKVVLNLFFGMFSVSFPTSHGYFSPYNNVCRKKDMIK